MTHHGGIIPGKNGRLSTSVDPGSPPSKTAPILSVQSRLMVEAAGTAPASEMSITRHVYCHSRQADNAYIGDDRGDLKAYS